MAGLNSTWVRDTPTRITLTQFQNKYRVESARLKGWDYSRAGWYYVTICTQGRACHFGAMTNAQLIKTTAGEIVAEEWQRTPLIRPAVELDEWVLMPNHLHGILVIREAEEPATQPGTVNGSLKTGSLGAIIGQIKSISKKRINSAGVAGFEWQARFYDHIIRDDRGLANIRAYIVNNPAQWELDELNPERQPGRH
jgi:putative transposase